jgi:hypothetical protein
MNQPIPANAQVATFIVPLVVIALVVLRNSRARRLRIETLWIAPVMILLLVGLSLSQEGMPSPLGLAVDIAALAVGAGLGWWRARFTHITIDQESHQLTSQASPLGMLVILVVFAVRYGLRTYAVENAASMGLPVNIIADAALVLTIGLVCAQRFEIFTRASRMLAEARASSGGSA